MSRDTPRWHQRWPMNQFLRFVAPGFTRAWFRVSPSQRHSCHKCGFLAVRVHHPVKGGVYAEAQTGVRAMVAAEGDAGWFRNGMSIRCYRGLWSHDPDEETDLDTSTREVNGSRWYCRGFVRYSAGRGPKEHLGLEDEQREYGYKKKLAWFAFIGALVGAALGDMLKSILSAR